MIPTTTMLAKLMKKRTLIYGADPCLRQDNLPQAIEVGTCSTPVQHYHLGNIIWYSYTCKTLITFSFLNFLKVIGCFIKTISVLFTRRFATLLKRRESTLGMSLTSRAICHRPTEGWRSIECATEKHACAVWSLVHEYFTDRERHSYTQEYTDKHTQTQRHIYAHTQTYKHTDAQSHHR